MPDTTILDDHAVAEIEALSAKVPDGPWFTAYDDAEDVPDHRRSGLALVETGRSDDWWIARLCEWHIANFIAASKANVDALCQTVRALRAENSVFRRAFETDAALSEPKVGDLNALQVVKKLEQLATQLAAVTQERETARAFVTRLTVEKQKLEAIISAYENQDEEALAEAEQL